MVCLRVSLLLKMMTGMCWAFRYRHKSYFAPTTRLFLISLCFVFVDFSVSVPLVWVGILSCVLSDHCDILFAISWPCVVQVQWKQVSPEQQGSVCRILVTFAVCHPVRYAWRYVGTLFQSGVLINSVNRRAYDLLIIIFLWIVYETVHIVMNESKTRDSFLIRSSVFEESCWRIA